MFINVLCFAALRVHLSPFVYEHLETQHPNIFDSVKRGNGIQIKGKGLMQTYWLLGKKGFPYRIDLDETVRIADSMTYWRLDNTDADGH